MIIESSRTNLWLISADFWGADTAADTVFSTFLWHHRVPVFKKEYNKYVPKKITKQNIQLSHNMHLTPWTESRSNKDSSLKLSKKIKH